jgi:voltage-gated potassium channel Kch
MEFGLNIKNSWSSIKHYRRQMKFLYLLCSMIFLIVVSPFLQHGVGSEILLIFMVTAVLLSAINSVSDKRTHLIVACLLAAPWFVTSVATTLFGTLYPEFYEALFGSLFFTYTTVLIFSHVLKDKKVTSDTLYGAICVYILIGLTWSFFYVLIATTSHDAFHINPANNLDNIINWHDLTYFSFVTLTTLGYGDITPVAPIARPITILEAIVGPIYLTIIIARLVGLYISGTFLTKGK